MRVVIADDSVLLREGLARVLAEAGFEVVGSGRRRRALLTAVASCSPTSPSSTSGCRRRFTDEGTQAAIALRAEHPDLRMLVLSQIVEARTRCGSSASAGGVRLPAQGPCRRADDFVDAVHRVARGGTAIDPEVVAQLLGRRAADDPLAELTPREREVLGLMAEGRSNGDRASSSSARRPSRRT